MLTEGRQWRILQTPRGVSTVTEEACGPGNSREVSKEAEGASWSRRHQFSRYKLGTGHRYWNLAEKQHTKVMR